MLLPVVNTLPRVSKDLQFIGLKLSNRLADKSRQSLDDGDHAHPVVLRALGILSHGQHAVVVVEHSLGNGGRQNGMASEVVDDVLECNMFGDQSVRRFEVVV